MWALGPKTSLCRSTSQSELSLIPSDFLPLPVFPAPWSLGFCADLLHAGAASGSSQFAYHRLLSSASAKGMGSGTS